MFRISTILLLIGLVCVACNHDRPAENAPQAPGATLAATNGAQPMQSGGMGGTGGMGAMGGMSGTGGVSGTGGSMTR